MKHIHMIGLGGSIQGANMEVHDLQLMAAETLQDCLPEVTKRWYGESLHIDSHTVLSTINGYDVSLENGDREDLYLIVYGGYNTDQIDEVHTYDIVLATDEVDAKRYAKTQMNLFPYIDHVDNVVNVSETIGQKVRLIRNKDARFRHNTTKHMFLKIR